MQNVADHTPMHDNAGAMGDGRNTYGVFMHLIGLVSLLDAAFLSAIGTLIMWLIKRDEDSFLDDHGREAMNFQITLVCYWLLFFCFVLLTFGVGLVLAPVMYVFVAALRIIGCVRGAIAAGNGRHYRYPMCIRLIPSRL